MMSLLSPYKMGDLSFRNRMVMAPMTRCRAMEGNVPGPLTVTYYSQRVSAGLIITEGSQVSPLGVGFNRTPGIYSPEQVAGWKKVTAAVHQGGGNIFLQLWHVGRMSHPDYLGGAMPVAPSAIPVLKRFIPRRERRKSRFPGPCQPVRSRILYTSSGRERRMPGRQDLMAWRSTGRTVTCWTSSCGMDPTGVLTTTGAA